ncbi:hypothetical protein FB451DRAFT_1378082 [Mycena latifolia]|nr:hypothetical protein FB451DRAFT_1378082 [Mycena latifolia]
MTQRATASVATGGGASQARNRTWGTARRGGASAPALFLLLVLSLSSGVGSSFALAFAGACSPRTPQARSSEREWKAARTQPKRRLRAAGTYITARGAAAAARHGAALWTRSAYRAPWCRFEEQWRALLKLGARACTQTGIGGSVPGSERSPRSVTADDSDAGDVHSGLQRKAQAVDEGHWGCEGLRTACVGEEIRATVCTDVLSTPRRKATRREMYGSPSTFRGGAHVYEDLGRISVSPEGGLRGGNGRTAAGGKPSRVRPENAAVGELGELGLGHRGLVVRACANLDLDRSIPTSIPEGSGPHNRADAWEFPFSANLEVSTQNSCGISKNHPINLNFGYVTLGWFGALGDLCQLDECG